MIHAPQGRQSELSNLQIRAWPSLRHTSSSSYYIQHKQKCPPWPTRPCWPGYSAVDQVTLLFLTKAGSTCHRAFAQAILPAQRPSRGCSFSFHLSLSSNILHEASQTTRPDGNATLLLDRTYYYFKLAFHLFILFYFPPTLHCKASNRQQPWLSWPLLIPSIWHTMNSL